MINNSVFCPRLNEPANATLKQRDQKVSSIWLANGVLAKLFIGWFFLKISTLVISLPRTAEVIGWLIHQSRRSLLKIPAHIKTSTVYSMFK